MRVAFVNVNLKEGEFRDRELTFYNQKCSIELGTLYLAANVDWLPEDRVEHINTLHCALQCLDWRRKLSDFEPDIVALSALTYYAPELAAAIETVKNDTGAITIAGGPHVTAVGAEVMQISALDFAFPGEGESGFRAFIDLCRNPCVSPSIVPGLLWRDGKEVHVNKRCKGEDLELIRFPTRSQVDPFEYAKYSSILNFKVPHMPIVTTRGCPYQCVYCHEIMGKSVRYRSVESVLREVDHWFEQGIRTFLINDDIFNVNRRRAQAIFRKFAERGGLRFAFPNGLRADLLDEETIDAFVEGGMFYAMVAVESGDLSMQQHIKKRLKLDKTLEMIEYMGHAGVIVGSFNIFGFPGETEEQIETTIRFNESARGLSKANFFVLNPHKGTAVYDMALAEGYVPEGATQGYFNVLSTSPTRHVSSERLAAMRNDAYRRFYLAPDRINRVLSADARNMSRAERHAFHQIDYSYVLRQFLGLQTVADHPDRSIRESLSRLLPTDVMQRY